MAVSLPKILNHSASHNGLRKTSSITNSICNGPGKTGLIAGVKIRSGGTGANLKMKSKNQINVALLGDGITRGRFGYNWAGQLARELPDMKFLNFGHDGDLAYQALGRIDSLVETKPDYVFILLGTNDVFAIMSEANTRRYVKLAKLPQNPTLEWFVANMEQIIVRLLVDTHAEIAVISLPVMGEDLHHEANRNIEKYNIEISRLCKKHEIGFLNLNQRMMAFLRRQMSESPKALPDGLGLVAKSILRKYLLGQSWDKISKINGLSLTTDCIHLNSTGGKMLAALVKHFIAAQEA